MKVTLNIAKTELQDLFYSPVAWLLLAIFSFQTGSDFVQLVTEIVKTQAIGHYGPNATMYIFGGWSGLFVKVQSYLYLYIPILTMGMMSRELSSGSIKLLYSSPITNVQIILGKYLGMVMFGIILMGILFIYAIYGIIAIENVDTPTILTGLLGIFLLLSTYIAIGLFMSSLTSYQIVAAIGTLAILAALEHIGGVLQYVDFIREITYWLAISGRASNFMRGMLSSEDVVYFITVITFFICMTLIRLQLRRQHVRVISIVGKIVGIFIVIALIAMISSYPKCKFYKDVTYTKQNTITHNSQEIVNQLSDGLKITTYVNILDQNSTRILNGYSEDIRRFEKYTRFKPDIEMEYIYYYEDVKNPLLEILYPETTLEEKVAKIIDKYNINSNKVLTPEQIKKQIDLSGEGYRLVRLLQKESGEKVFLRIYNDMEVFPSESEISVAMKKLITAKLPVVGFLTGHGERTINQHGERSYTSFTRSKNVRQALINQGFDFKTITLDQDIPEDVNILVIAEMRTAMTTEERERFKRYIETGRDVMLIGDVGYQEIANSISELLGVKFIDGYLIQPENGRKRSPNIDHTGKMVNNVNGKPLDLIMLRPTKEAMDISYILGRNHSQVMALPGATGLDYSQAENMGFKAVPLLKTDSTCWNELDTKDLINEIATCDPTRGEIKKSYTVAVALSRQIGNEEQKIVVLSDADGLSNADISRARAGREVLNYGLAIGAFHWMSDGEFPIDVRRPTPIDCKFNLTENRLDIFKYIIIGGIPISLIFLFLILWLRRRKF